MNLMSYDFEIFKRGNKYVWTLLVFTSKLRFIICQQNFQANEREIVFKKLFVTCVIYSQM